jgi:hypothetical protein
MSANYRKINNIYTKIGMHYVDDDGGPEMHSNIEHIVGIK